MATKKGEMVTVDKNIEEKMELYNKLKNGYKHKNGIMVYATFNKDGDNITDCWRRYVREKLKG